MQSSSIGLGVRLATTLFVGINIGQPAPVTVLDQIIDYTCDPNSDYGVRSTCSTVDDGVCDDSNLGGKGWDGCRNQDCFDCNYHCSSFDADCYGCLGAKGCYYCPGDATYQNSNLYMSRNKTLTCITPNDYWLGGTGGVDPTACVSPDSVTKDPLEHANRWAYNMINVVPVWQELGWESSSESMTVL